MSGMDFFGITFADPWVLSLLILLPLIALLKGKFGGTPGVVFSSTEMLERIGVRRRSAAGSLLAALSLVALAALIIGAARPQFGRTVTRVEASGIDIMVAIDVSRSMLAEDFSIGQQRANRLEAVREVTEQFIRERPNDRIGIVAFAGRPYMVSPLTLDHDWLIQNLDRVQIGMVEDGTAIGSAIASASSRLKDKEAKSKIIVLLTDGDNNSGKVTPATAAEAAKALDIKIYTIGAGARGTAPFPLQDAFGRTVYRNIQVEFDEGTLREIAAIADGEYFRATDTRTLENIFREIDKLEKSNVEIERIAQYTDLFSWFLMVGLCFLAAESVISQTVWRRLP